MKEMFGNDTSKYKTYWGKTLKADDYANPCGLVAKAFFNGKIKSKKKKIILKIIFSEKINFRYLSVIFK